MNKRLVSALFTLLFSFLFLVPGMVVAQTEADELPAIDPRGGVRQTMLVDCPTAWTLERASFDLSMRSYPNGGILAGVDIGLSNRLTLGISYGAEGIIAESKPTWNPRVEFNVKLKAVDESIVMPAVAIGFCSQGYGAWHDRDSLDLKTIDRYTFKSKGFYAVGSKSYMVGQFQTGLHGGVNYSTEQEDDDGNVTFFAGTDIRLNKDIGIVLEYDFALNDDIDGGNFGKGYGYLNASVQWIYASNLVMEFLLKNLTNNRRGTNDIWRGLRVTYVEYF
ncbi:MAG: hypothetical protein R3F48_07615 [Candidatus Zixiibacteriota bacterium]